MGTKLWQFVVLLYLVRLGLGGYAVEGKGALVITHSGLSHTRENMTTRPISRELCGGNEERMRAHSRSRYVHSSTVLIMFFKEIQTCQKD